MRRLAWPSPRRDRRVWWLTAIAGTVGAMFFFEYVPEMALADSINGRVSLTYAHTETTSTDVTGASTDFSARTLLEQYNLSADKNIFPNLRLYASGIFQTTESTTSTNGQGSWSDVAVIRPYVDLNLRTPVYNFGVNYNSATTETKTLNSPNTTFKFEAYTGILGWRPQDLPTVDLWVAKTFNYDVTRTVEDTVADTVSLFSHWEPTKTVRLRYQGSYADNDDRLSQVETKTLGNDIRVMYDDQFLPQGRIGVSSYYDYSYSTMDTITSGKGTVSFPVLAVNGLFQDTDILVTGTLPPAPFLTDNVMTGPTNEPNNIGSATSLAVPPDTTARNIGLQFALATEINRLDVWVFSVTGVTVDTSLPAYLPTPVAEAFTWAVYTSADNLNWQLFQAGATATYVIDASRTGVARFEITFPNVVTKFVKVVVSPLSPAAAGGQSREFPGIFVTELQAFIARPAASVTGTSSSTTQLGSLSTHVLLLQHPALYYNFAYFFNDSQTQFSTTRTSTLSNQLAAQHQFNPVFSGSAQVQRIDNTGPGGSINTTQTGVQLTAVPLRTLSHTLGFSASSTQDPQGSSKSIAMTLTNTAELYHNLTAFLNGGGSNSVSEFGQRVDSTNYNGGLNIIPIETLNITLSAGGQRSDLTGAGAPPTTQSSQNTEMDVSWYPFRTLYLFGQRILTKTTGSRQDRITNYGLNFSPFPGGDLVLNYSYNESLRALDNSVTKTSIPSLRWNITRWAYLLAAYSSIESTSNLGESTTRTYSSSLNMTF